MKPIFLALVLVSTLLSPSIALSCEPCAVYNATDLHGFAEHKTKIAISNIYTDFETNKRVPRLQSGEVLDSFNAAELSFSYDVNERLSFNASVPFLSRSFTEFSDFRRRDDSEHGLGDASILVQYVPILEKSLDTTIYWAINSGVKLPTGDTGSLENSEQVIEVEDRLAHHVGGAASSGVQGRGLSLGSGSYDFLFGTKLFLRHQRYFFYGSFQYALRTEGDFDYEFADDFVWNAGPAYYVYLGDHDLSVAVRATFSGEDKGNDTLEGRVLSGTSVVNVYAGPEFLITAFGQYTGELGIDVPIVTDSSTIEKPNWRLRLSLGYRF